MSNALAMEPNVTIEKQLRKLDVATKEVDRHVA
jgi:hypothetical protein